MCVKVVCKEFSVRAEFCVHGAVCVEQDRVQRAAFCELQCVLCAVCVQFSVCMQLAMHCVVCIVHCAVCIVQCAVCCVQCSMAATAPASALSEQRERRPNPTDEMISKLFVIFPAVAAPAKKTVTFNRKSSRVAWTMDMVRWCSLILLTNVSSNISQKMMISRPQ